MVPELMQRYMAAGKLLLFGEHSAVYGEPALGVGLDRGLRLEVRRAVPLDGPLREDPTIVLASGNEERIEGFGSHMDTVWRTFGIPDIPVEIFADGDLPISGGFGSSAAFCTALATWGMERAGLHQDLLWPIAHDLERAFHGTPSGIDTGIVSAGGLCAFYFDNAEAALPRRDLLNAKLPPLVVGSIAREAPTRELVERVSAKRRENRAVVDAALSELGTLARSAIDGIPSMKPEQLGGLADAAHGELKGLGVSTPRLESILKRGRSAGAHGGKLSGAGAGGAFFLVCDSPASAATVREEILPMVPDGPLFVFHRP